MLNLPLFNPQNITKEDFLTGQIILFDKPYKWTSFDLVRRVRGILARALRVKKIKVGHAGTLDPLATGLMIICTGKATKLIDSLMGYDKEYIATMELGRTTPSYDLETQTDRTFEVSHITKELVENTLKAFIGDTYQRPPLFSAKNIDGVRAYTLAREGQNIELPPSLINISEIEILSFELPKLVLRIKCSKGTYIRALARDIGENLHSGATLTALQRTKIGPFSIQDTIVPEYLNDIVKNTLC